MTKLSTVRQIYGGSVGGKFRRQEEHRFSALSPDPQTVEWAKTPHPAGKTASGHNSRSPAITALMHTSTSLIHCVIV